ncbi:MAG: B3/4 domain-containing protein [Candidatus Zhuqueibacterota bacterium]
MEMKLVIDPALRHIVQVGHIGFEEVVVSAINVPLVQEMEALGAQLRRQYGSPQDARDRLNVTRQFYRSIGLDPTKTRPSSEALLRRVLKGDSIYQINSVVDICNLCSLSFLLSIGLYDVEKIQWPAHLRLGAEGEGYHGIGKEYINLNGRLALVDRLGPFGNPSSDSDRTKITLESREVLFVVFAPRTYPIAQLENHLDFIEEKMRTYHSSKTGTRGIL